MYNIPIHRQIRFKITGTYILLVTAIVVTTSIFSFQTADREFQYFLNHEFQNTRNVTNNFLKFVEQTALIAAKSSADEKELLEILATGDTDALSSKLHSLMEKNTADVITLLDHEGIVLARGHDPKSHGDSLRAFDFVNDIISGKETTTAIVQDLSKFILYGTASFIHPTTKKPLHILAGYALNNNFVDNIQDNTQINVSLIKERSVVSTTLRSNGRRITTLPIPYLEYEILLANPGQLLETQFLGKDYYISTERLPLLQENMAGSMLLIHSLDDLKAIKKQLYTRYILIFAGSLIVGISIIILLTEAILQPIQQLVRTTKQISTGNLQNRIVIDSKDELGLLSDHFNKMADTIQEKDNAIKLHNKELEDRIDERTAEILEQSTLLNNVLSSSKDLSIAITDMDMRIKYFNPVAEKLLGYKAEEVLGKTVLEIHEEGRADPERFHRIIEIIKEKGFYNYEVKQQQDGEVKFIESTVTGVIDEKGVLNGFVLMSKDVTERKHMEQLRQAKAAAELANKAKSEFLANISHELRTPMHGILSYSQFGIQRIDKVSKDKLLEYFSEIDDSGNRLMVLLNDLLDLAKLEAGKMNYRIETSNLKDQISHVIKELSATSQEKGIQVQGPSSFDIQELQFDRNRIAQVLRNLLSNAIKFSNPGGKIRFETSEIKEFGALFLLVTVVDQGPGIPGGEQGTIFGKFIQSSKTKTGAGGTGLGLAICKQIVEYHGGRIWAENNPEGGALFCFTLPCS